MNEVSVTLDISKHPHRLQTLRIGQNDKNAPVLKAEILDHSTAFNLAGYGLSFEMLKPKGGVYSVEGTSQGNVATFVLDGMEPGKSDIAYVVIQTSNMRVSTQRISVEVLEGANS